MSHHLPAHQRTAAPGGGASSPPTQEWVRYPPTWALPEVVQVPETVPVAEGKPQRFEAARARVYWLLRYTKERAYRHPIGSRHHGPPGWVPRFLLTEPWAGGDAGDRRVRELREWYGCRVDIETFDSPDGLGSTTRLYRLEHDPIATGRAVAAAPAPRPAPPAQHASTPSRPAPQQHGSTSWDLAVRYWTSRGAPSGTDRPGQPRSLRLSNSLSLDPPAYVGLFAASSYLDTLRTHARTGLLQEELRTYGPTGVVLWGEFAQFDPWPDLRRALNALGATDMGWWG